MADYDLQYQDTHIDALLATANELKTAGYIYKGVATPSTNPGTPTERVAYLASEPGTYTNFGGIVIASGLYSLTYAGGTWTGTQMQAGSDIQVVQTTGDSTTDVMSQKAVTDLMLEENQIDISNYSSCGGYIDIDTAIFKTSSTYYGILIYFSQYRGKTIRFKKTTNMIRYAFTTGTLSNNVAVPFCSGESQKTYTTQQVDVVVPNDCTYLYIYVYSNGTNVRPTLYELEIISVIDAVDAFENTTITNIDINDYNFKGTSINAWFTSSQWLQDNEIRKTYLVTRQPSWSKFRLTANNSNQATCVLLSQIPSNGTSTGYIKFFTVPKRTKSYYVDIPDNCVYIAIAATPIVSSGAERFTPTRMEIHEDLSVKEQVVVANGKMGDVEYTETILPLTITDESCYYINNGEVAIMTNTNTKRAEPINVHKYTRVSAIFNLENSDVASAVFTNSFGVVVGERIFNDGIQFRLYDVPKGATMLYLCTKKNEYTNQFDQFNVNGVNGLNVDDRLKICELANADVNSHFFNVENDGLYFVDKYLNIGGKFDEDGFHAININS